MAEVFKEQEMYKFLYTTIRQSFNDTEWYNKFGKNNLTISNDLEDTDISLPFVHIDIYDSLTHEGSFSSYTRHRFTRFDFDITIYTQEIVTSTETISAKDISIEIKEKIKQVLVDYGFTFTTDKRIENIDRKLYRRLLSGNAVIDNEKQIIYKL